MTTNKTIRIVVAATLGLAAAFMPAQIASASGGTTLSFDFNTAGQLDNDFNSYVASGTVDQSADGGIGNTGSISTHDGDASAVFQPKAKYSIGPVGSSYSFAAYMKSVGNSGYSGFGFTATTPSAASDGVVGGPFRPSDALGISVHGGGFVFHNGSTNTDGSWSSDNSGITTIQTASIGDLLNNGSPDSWYKIVFSIKRVSETTFDIQVDVYPAQADGTLISQSAAASFKMVDQAAPALLSATNLYSYINFSGYRVTNFDGFATTVAGGVTVEGAPEGSLSGEPTTTSSGTDGLANTGGTSDDYLAVYSSAFALLYAGYMILRMRRRSARK